MSTQPSPAPQTGAQSQALKDAGLINLPAVGTGSGTGSKFGLDSAVASSTVNLGGLAALLNLPATASADDVMKAFATAKDPRTIAKIQAYLQAGNFYTGNASVNMGVVTAADISAFKGAVTTVAQTGADLTDFLTRQAQYGAYTGLAASMSGKQAPIKTADPLALGSMIDKEFQDLTGKKATPAEKAGFIAAYNAAYKTFQEQAAAATTQVTAGDPNYSTAPPAPITGAPDAATGARFSDHLSSDGPAIAAAQDKANLSAVPMPPAMGDPGTVQDSFDPSAFAEQYVRGHAPNETGAHDIAGQFTNFLQILKGIG